jgi:hypothetical protein
MKTRYLLPLLAVALYLAPLSSHAQVFWRVSVKVFTDSGGNRPSGRTDADIQDDYVYYNRLLGNYARGCQFSLVEIVQLPSSLSSWFNIAARDGGNTSALRVNATSNTVLYAYQNDMINIYINNSGSGFCCGGGINGLIFTGNENDHITPVHEIGHMLGLGHTQGCASCSEGCTAPGDDGVADTIEDVECWDRNDIALNSFGVNYNSASAGQRDQVDDVWFNIMSYHYGSFNNLLERLTPGQMDRVANTANSTRDNVTGNYFRFVDLSAGNDSLFNGLSTSVPFRTIDGAITGSGNDDVLVIRSGTYNKAVAGSWRITANRVLTSRNGTVRLTRTP